MSRFLSNSEQDSFINYNQPSDAENENIKKLLSFYAFLIMYPLFMFSCLYARFFFVFRGKTFSSFSLHE